MPWASAEDLRTFGARYAIYIVYYGENPHFQRMALLRKLLASKLATDRCPATAALASRGRSLREILPLAQVLSNARVFSGYRADRLSMASSRNLQVHNCLPRGSAEPKMLLT